MAKLSISLALVAAQVVSWATASLYTCISADGSTCIDRGPEFCACCGADSDHGAPHDSDHGASCLDHAKGPAAVEGPFCSAAPCDCDHQSMGDAQKATPNAKLALGKLTAAPTTLLPPSGSRSRAVVSAANSFGGATMMARISSLSTVALRC